MPQKLADVLLQNQGELRSRSMGPREYLTSALARVLGDNRDATALAENLVGAAEYSPLGALTGAYDVGQTAAQAGYAPSPQTVAAAGLTAATMAPMMRPLGRAMRAAVREAPQTAAMGLKAYHASPYEFERFDRSKIGTGEGTGMEGRGFYASDTPSVMEGYHQQFQQTHGKAHRYEVDINADPKDFADWHSLSPEMQAAVRDPASVKEMMAEGIAGVKYTDPTASVRPEDLARQQQIVRAYEEGQLTGRMGDSAYSPEYHQRAKDRLAEIEARLANAPKNYVVFDPSVMNIIRKYGMLPPFAGLGAAASQDNQQ